MLVLVKNQRRLLTARDLDGRDLLGKTPRFLSGSGFLLGAQGKSVLIFPGDIELLGDVFRRFRHGVDAKSFLHQRVDQTPANSGVFELLIASEGAISLAHYIGRAGHGLHAACQRQLHLTRFNGTKRGTDRIHTRAAQAVHGRAGH